MFLRASCLGMMVGWLGGLAPAGAEDNVVQNLNGTGSSATPVFKARDRWEIQWDAPSRLELTLCAADGTVVEGLSVSATGSLYEAKGGSFYLQVKDGEAKPLPWHVRIVELSAAPSGADVSGANYLPPSVVEATNAVVSAPAPAAVPAAAAASTHAPPAADSAKLTQDEARAIVVIKGDAAEGTGFLAQTPDGPVVVTNNHVAAANPNLKILTAGGEAISVLSLKGAIDRDLVMFAIKDNHYSYLDLDTDVEHTVLVGDEVITPGNGEGGEVVLDTDGTVRGVGPDKIEFSNPIFHGNSGGPIFHLHSRKVIGVVTQAFKVRITNEIDKSSFADAKSAITGPMRYFGFRLDSVPKWETYDWNRFLNETAFLKQFHLDSRCLDSFLNGAAYEKAKLTSEDPNDRSPNSRFFLQNEKIRNWSDTFHQLTANADKSQRLDAQRELVMNLQDFAARDMTAIQTPDNFYGFDQIRAKQEIAYRKALTTELGNIGSKISDLGH